VWVKPEVAVEEATEGDSDDDEEVWGKKEVEIEEFEEPDSLGLSEVILSINRLAFLFNFLLRV